MSSKYENIQRESSIEKRESVRDVCGDPCPYIAMIRVALFSISI